jgi:maltose alpha-D-glucosyltransferase/alpha-amylase
MSRYYEVVTMGNSTLPPLIEKPALKFEEAPAEIQQGIGDEFYNRIILLGKRTAEMHMAMAADTNTPEFAPEKITRDYQRSLYSSLCSLLEDRFSLLEESLPSLNQSTRGLAKEVLLLRDPILESFEEMHTTKLSAQKIRIHGDYHLGQVLWTGKDFIIIDFEGEPAFSFTERRSKKSPFKDVAGMMRSFHYAAYARILLDDRYRDYDAKILEKAAEQWQHYASRFFLGAYMEHFGLGTNLSGENRILIRTFLLEKAIYELGYELNARPDWVNVPLKGIQYLVSRYLQESTA